MVDKMHVKHLNKVYRFYLHVQMYNENHLYVLQVYHLFFYLLNLDEYKDLLILDWFYLD